MDISTSAMTAIRELDKLIPSLIGLSGRPSDWDSLIGAEIAADTLRASLHELHAELEQRRPLNVERIHQLAESDDEPMSARQAEGVVRLLAGA